MGERFDAVRQAIKESWIGRTANWINENIMPALAASGRQGLKEVAQVLPAFPDSVRPVEELGTLGNPTQLEVNMEKGVQASYQGFRSHYQEQAHEVDGLDRGGMER